jgi:hypothetical protein
LFHVVLNSLLIQILRDIYDLWLPHGISLVIMTYRQIIGIYDGTFVTCLPDTVKGASCLSLTPS